MADHTKSPPESPVSVASPNSSVISSASHIAKPRHQPAHSKFATSTSNQFSNIYWSSDYKTGINAIGRQCHKSLGQIRQLRQLVFSFVNYYSSNAEQILKVVGEVKSFENGHTRGRVTSAHQLRKRIASSGSGLTPPASRVSSMTSEVTGDLSPGSVDVFARWSQFMRQESDTLMALASVIDQEVLEGITSFIKFNEPKLRSMIETFNALAIDLEDKYDEVEKIRVGYDDALRMMEFKKEKLANDDKSDSLEDIKLDPTPSPPPEEKELPATPKYSSQFKFPMMLDTIKVTDCDMLETLVASLIDATPTSKRTLTLPGKSPDIFNSSDLVASIQKCTSISPTTMHLERFGQKLHDAKLIEPTSFWARKFKGEDMWFEWTELACQIANGDHIPSANAEDIDLQELTENTTKRISSMFQTMKTSLQKSHDVAELEKQYARAYLELQTLRHQLDEEIISKSQALEQFERLKIELIYRSLTRLAQVCYNSSVEQTGALHQLAHDFVDRLNLEENYHRELKQVVDEFSVGIYFPANVSPVNLEKKAVAQANNTFQNLKSQFNLYIDIPLQVSVVSVVPGAAPGLASVPYFLYQLGQFLASKPTRQGWVSPLDHGHYWVMKQAVITDVETFAGDAAVVPTHEQEIHKEIIDRVVDTLTTNYSVDQVVNFLKNWLLDIGDSLIPGMVYDSIIQVYSTHDDDVSAAEHMLKVLGTIPRANLSALVYILDLVCRGFELPLVEGYPEKVNKSKHGAVVMTEIIHQLNSMDSIGGVPFLHLILRPSFSKISTGFKPPLPVYAKITASLLVLPTREHLFSTLLTNENNYVVKKQKQKHALQVGVKKKPDLVVPKSRQSPVQININESGSLPASNPISADFAPRPFKTKLTPQPSPSGSPKTSPGHTPRNSMDLSTRSKSPVKRLSLLANADVKISE